MILKHIKRNFKIGSIYTLGNILNRGIPLLLMPYLTRVLPPHQYGLVSLFLSLTVLLTAIMGFSSNTVISQKYFKVSNDERAYLVSDALKLSFIGFILLLIIILPFSALIDDYFEIPQWLLFTSLIVSFMNIWFLIAKVILQVEKKAMLYAFGINSITLFNIVFSILFISLFNLGWNGRILGFLLSSFLSMLLSIFVLIKLSLLNKKSLFNTKYLNEIFILGLALVPSSIGGWIYSLGDRFVLSGLLSNEAVGLYAASFSLASLIDIVATPVGLVWAPIFFDKKAKSNDETNHIVNKVSCVLAIGYLFIAVVGTFALPLFAKIFLGAKFIQSSFLVPWLVFGFAFRSIAGLLSYYILHNENNILLTIHFLINSVFSLGLSIMMIKLKGLIGIAQANCFSGLIGLFLMLLFVKISNRVGVKNGYKLSE